MRGLAKHQLDVYGTHLHFATRPKAWARLRADLGFLDEDPPESAGLTHDVVSVPDETGLSEHHVVLWVNGPTHASAPVDQLVDTIAHEATHAADAIFERIEERTIGAEQRAYLVGWLAGWMWRNAGLDG